MFAEFDFGALSLGFCGLAAALAKSCSPSSSACADPWHQHRVWSSGWGQRQHLEQRLLASRRLLQVCEVANASFRFDVVAVDGGLALIFKEFG